MFWLQRRFFINSTYSSSNVTYQIPITYTTKASPNFNYTKPVLIMEGATQEITLNDPITDDSWIIFNIQETGKCKLYVLFKKRIKTPSSLRIIK